MGKGPLYRVAQDNHEACFWRKRQDAFSHTRIDEIMWGQFANHYIIEISREYFGHEFCVAFFCYICAIEKWKLLAGGTKASGCSDNSWNNVVVPDF
jgi:hypothetical protein